MAVAEARLISYTVRLPDLEDSPNIDLREFSVRAVYGQPGNCRWHRGRVAMADDRELVLLVRDVGRGTDAAKAWGKVLKLAHDDGWYESSRRGRLARRSPGRLAPPDREEASWTSDVRRSYLSCSSQRAVVWHEEKAPAIDRAMVNMRDGVERAIDDFYRARCKEDAYIPTSTVRRLRCLQKALKDVKRDCAAVEFLDEGYAAIRWQAVWEAWADPERRPLVEANQWDKLKLPEHLYRPIPAGRGAGGIQVSATELVERLEAAAAMAVVGPAGKLRRGRKPKAALRRLVARLAHGFEWHSGRRAVPTTGGPFWRFVAAVLGYQTALHGGRPIRIQDSRVVSQALQDYRKQHPWPLPVPAVRRSGRVHVVDLCARASPFHL